MMLDLIAHLTITDVPLVFLFLLLGFAVALAVQQVVFSSEE